MRVILFVVLLALLSGCWSHEAARPQSGLVTERGSLSEVAWPARDTERVRELMERTPREIFTLRLREGVDPASISDSDREAVKPTAEVVYKAIHARNLLRLVKQPEKDPNGFIQRMEFMFMGFKPNGYLISSRTLEALEKRKAVEARLRPDAPPTKPSSPEVLAKVKFEMVDNSALHLESGLPVHIPEPREGVKGLLIHLQSLGANDYEPQVLDEFRKRGWAVVDLKPQSFITSPVPEEWYDEIKSLETEYRDLMKGVFAEAVAQSDRLKPREVSRLARSHPNWSRYMEVETRLGKLRRGGFQACSDEDRSRVAAEIAAQIDQGMAGAAYAVESILDYVDTQRRDLQGMPTVLMGFSAGALATPTAAAWMESVKPGRLSGVVVIAGGCNLLRIARESSFSDGGLKILCGEEPVKKEVESQLFDLYLSASKLDPYHTAPLIAHLPVLQVHATKDTWVPAPTGELLHQRLNYPERLTLRGDHDILFYLLTQKQKWIADWVEREVHPVVAQSAKAAINRAVR